MYEVGLGDSPSSIAGYLSGNPHRYGELLAANPHKSIVHVRGAPTFQSLGVGEQLVVPSGFVGDALARAFGVGSHEEAFAQLAHTFGTAAPADAFARIAQTFGTSGQSTCCDFNLFSLGDVGTAGFFDDIGHAVSNVGNAVNNAVNEVGKAAGQAANTVANVANSAAHEAQKAVAAAAQFAGQVGHDVGKFAADQAAAFAKNPLGTLAKIAAGGPLALINPDAILHGLGVPTPTDMLHKLGLPSPSEILPDPSKMAGNIISAISTGDLNKIKSSIIDTGHQFADIVAMVPGVGNVVGGPFNAALALLESGSPLRASLELMLGQIPGIPPEIRDVFLRPAIDGVADVVEKHESVTDAIVTSLKDGIMAEAEKRGIPDPIRKIIGDFVDAAMQLILQHKPLDQVATSFVKHGLLDTATRALGSQIHLPDIAGKLSSLQKSMLDMSGIEKKLNEIQAMTKGLVRLKQMDPSKLNPGIQKQIADLKASIEARRLGVHAHSKSLDTNLGARPPHVPQRPHVEHPRPPHAVRPHPRPPAPVHALAPAPAYGPYPTVALSGPPHGHHGHHGGGHPFRRGGGGWGNWGWGWGVPWSPEVVTTVETCQTWSDPIAPIPPPMATAARSALNASGGRPTAVRGPDNVLYLFAIENGSTVARACAAIARA